MLTHADLVTLAARWARRQRRYPIVLSDVRMTCINEQPDVIAFGLSGSLLIECKASRGDFLRDALKPFRRDPSRGLGHVRYYCAPEGILTPHEDLPEGWGLLVPTARGSLRVEVVPSPVYFDVDQRAERAILVGALVRATEGWGRRMFGESAPMAPDGDPDPTTARVIRKQREHIQRLGEDLRVARSSKAGGQVGPC